MQYKQILQVYLAISLVMRYSIAASDFHNPFLAGTHECADYPLPQLWPSLVTVHNREQGHRVDLHHLSQYILHF